MMKKKIYETGRPCRCTNVLYVDSAEELAAKIGGYVKVIAGGTILSLHP